MGTQSSKPRKTTIEQDEFTGSIQVSEGVARRLFQPRLQTKVPALTKDVVSKLIQAPTKDVVSKLQAPTVETVSKLHAPTAEIVESFPIIIKDAEAVESSPIITKDAEAVESSPIITKHAEAVESSPIITKHAEVVESSPIITKDASYDNQKKESFERTSESPVRDAVLTKSLDSVSEGFKEADVEKIVQTQPNAEIIHQIIYDGLKEADVEKLVQTQLTTERKHFDENLQNQRSHYEKLLSTLLKEEDVEKYVQTELHKERNTFQEDLHKQKSYYEHMLSDLQTQYNNNLTNLRNQFDDNLNLKLSKIPESRPSSLEDDIHYHLKITTDKLKEKEALLEHVSTEKNFLYQEQKKLFEEMNADMQKAICENASKVEAEKSAEIQMLKESQVNEMHEFKVALNDSFNLKEISLELREQEKEEALKNLMNQKEELLGEMIQQKENELDEKEIDRQVTWEKKEEDHNEMIRIKEKEREESWNKFVKEHESLMNEKELEREALFSKKEMENEEIRQKKVQLIKSDLESKLNDYKEKLHVADGQNKSLFESSEEALKQSVAGTQKKFPMPLRSSVCSENATEVLQCLQTNVRKPLLCSATVKAFSLCVQSRRTNSVKL